MDENLLTEHHAKLADHNARISVLESRSAKMDEQLDKLENSTTRLLEVTKTLARWHWFFVTAVASGLIALAFRMVH